LRSERGEKRSRPKSEGRGKCEGAARGHNFAMEGRIKKRFGKRGAQAIVGECGKGMKTVVSRTRGGGGGEKGGQRKG